MPLTLKVPEGALSEQAEGKLFPELIDTFLRVGGASGNRFITPNMIGDIVTIPKGRMFAGLERVPYVELQLKVPAFALTERRERDEFVAKATDLIHAAIEGQVDKARIFINLVYGDGMWGIGGKVYSNFELQDAVIRAS